MRDGDAVPTGLTPCREIGRDHEDSFGYEVSLLECGYALWMVSLLLAELGQALKALAAGWEVYVFTYLASAWNIIDILILALFWHGVQRSTFLFLSLVPPFPPVTRPPNILRYC